jgi:hypothetical protein
MTRDPLAVARDLACLPRGARSAGLRCAIRCPCPADACDPLAVAPAPLPAIRWPWRPWPILRSAIRWPRSAGRGDPAPAPGRSGVIRWPIRHPMADGRSDGRSGVIRWPIRAMAIRWPRRHPMADPMADPASSDGRSAADPWRDPLPDPGSAIRCPRSAVLDTRSACQGPLWQLRLNGP